MRVIHEVEVRVDRPEKRFEASAARQLEDCLHAPRQPKALAGLVDIEMQPNRFRNRIRVVRLPEELGRVDFVHGNVRRPDVAQIQEHEPFNIPHGAGVRD